MQSAAAVLSCASCAVRSILAGSSQAGLPILGAIIDALT